MKALSLSKTPLLRLPVFLLVACVLTFSSCKKSTSSTEDDSVSASDETQATAAMNSATDDASYVAGNTASVSGLSTGGDLSSIANATIDTSQAATSKVITINYSGYALNSTLKRSGQVTITLVSGTNWSQINAVIAINFNGVIYSDGTSSITLNGTHYLTNTTGGLAWKIVAGLVTGTVTHKHTASNFTITFANGSQRTWSVSRSRSYTYASGVVTITLSGDSTVNGTANVDVVGTNRYGNEFINAITTPISVNNDCLEGFFRPYTGEDIQTVLNRQVTILFGVNASGVQVGSSSDCAYGALITYEKNGTTKATIIWPYWL